MKNHYDWWTLNLEGKPDFDKCMDRIYAWFESEIIDRPPVRFYKHNSEYNIASDFTKNEWKTLKDRWFDEEYQVKSFMRQIKGKIFLGETFPVFWPNLGPNIYAAFYGNLIEFGEVTSWAEPLLENYDDIHKLKLDLTGEYFTKIESITRCALELCEGKFMVGYTDLHPGMDCCAAWRGTESLCMDLYDEPESVKQLMNVASQDFLRVFNYFDYLLKLKKQLSVTWMGIPSFGKMHIPSCDFSSMISKEQFREFCLPEIKKEVKDMSHNIFHLDGKDVAKHIDDILQIKEIQAIQWVQGVGDDHPIIQWIPLIKKIQSAGKSIVVDLDIGELEEFICSVNPRGIYLCIAANSEEEEKVILKRVEKW